MKLKNLIEKLQAIENKTKDGEIIFQFVKVVGDTHTIQAFKFFDICGEAEGCFVTFSDYEEHMMAYKEQVKTLKEQSLR